MNEFGSKMNPAWWALRIGLGSAAFLTGLDKYFNLLANWGDYLSPLATRILPDSSAVFMHSIGIIEMAVGLAILTRWTRVGSYVAMLWLVAIAMNLLTTGHYFDIAVQDLEMAIAAFTLGRLTETREPATAAEQGLRKIADFHGHHAGA
jgi:hypothetical protein